MCKTATSDGAVPGACLPTLGRSRNSQWPTRLRMRTQGMQNSGKHPRRRNWQQEATSDEELILEWVVKWPNANFGVVMGEIAIALDLDVRADKDGVVRG